MYGRKYTFDLNNTRFTIYSSFVKANMKLCYCKEIIVHKSEKLYSRNCFQTEFSIQFQSSGLSKFREISELSEFNSSTDVWTHGMQYAVACLEQTVIKLRKQFYQNTLVIRNFLTVYWQ